MYTYCSDSGEISIQRSTRQQNLQGAYWKTTYSKMISAAYQNSLLFSACTKWIMNILENMYQSQEGCLEAGKNRLTKDVLKSIDTRPWIDR